MTSITNTPKRSRRKRQPRKELDDGFCRSSDGNRSATSNHKKARKRLQEDAVSAAFRHASAQKRWTHGH